ncbi:sensor histidine kinase [Agrilactobacillus yilanensis]|uniref:histidine kinase n=1 Tax=Agrilactobacillus yilanensis TaxID=2485997 RepID=A0ABW4J4Z2_9LACO|nr:HAMP domain-containing sensor histidine kinase [Agrilactobacillus yilanensis]
MAETKPAPSYEKVINQAIRRLVISITLAISIIILIFVAAQQSVNTAREAQGLMMSLNRANVNSIPNFIQWNNQANRHTKQNTFIRVKTKDKSVTAASFKRDRVIMTTPSSKKFLASKNYHIYFLKNVVYIPNYGLFLYYTQKNSKTAYQLWVSLNNTIKNLLILLVLTIFAIFITVSFGSLWARRLAQRLSAPTLSLANEAKKSSQNLEQQQPNLSVPDSPLEIHELGTAFNGLLSAQNQRLLRERQFISDASHELRTPIAAIRGNIGLIKRRGEAHPEVIPESLDFIDAESLRMQELIENLLHLSRADKAKIDFKPLNLTALIQRLSQHYQPMIPQPLQLELAADVIVSGNDDILQQILVALLDNARKYTPEDQPITLGLTQTKTAVEITVADLGDGIPDDQKSAIFQRFYRVDQSHSATIKGSGLGLAIVAQLVKLSQGTITVLDNQPTGSIFKITLPKTD